MLYQWIHIYIFRLFRLPLWFCTAFSLFFQFVLIDSGVHHRMCKIWDTKITLFDRVVVVVVCVLFIVMDTHQIQCQVQPNLHHVQWHVVHYKIPLCLHFWIEAQNWKLPSSLIALWLFDDAFTIWTRDPIETKKRRRTDDTAKIEKDERIQLLQGWD